MNKIIAPFILSAFSSTALANESGAYYYTLPYVVNVECIEDNLRSIFNVPYEPEQYEPTVYVISNHHDENGHEFNVWAYSGHNPGNVTTSFKVVSSFGTMRTITTYELIHEDETMYSVDLMDHESSMNNNGEIEYIGHSGDFDAFGFNGLSFHQATTEQIMRCFMPALM